MFIVCSVKVSCCYRPRRFRFLNTWVCRYIPTYVRELVWNCEYQYISGFLKTWIYNIPSLRIRKSGNFSYFTEIRSLICEYLIVWIFRTYGSVDTEFSFIDLSSGGHCARTVSRIHRPRVTEICVFADAWKACCGCVS